MLAALCGAPTEPSAEALLAEARLRPTAHPITLNAEIRGGEEPLPLIFKIEEGHIEYILNDPEEKIILTLGKNQTALTDSQQGKTSSLSNEQRYQNIRNTGVTYDDLSLGFLYWPHPRLAKSERLRGTKASVLELFPPADDHGPYGSARLWIDENTGAPLRMEGFDKNRPLLTLAVGGKSKESEKQSGGVYKKTLKESSLDATQPYASPIEFSKSSGNLLKRFEVISAQKIDSLWMLKEMRIETFDPQTHAVTQRRYLTIHRDGKK